MITSLECIPLEIHLGYREPPPPPTYLNTHTLPLPPSSILRHLQEGKRTDRVSIVQLLDMAGPLCGLTCWLENFISHPPAPPPPPPLSHSVLPCLPPSLLLPSPLVVLQLQSLCSYYQAEGAHTHIHIDCWFSPLPEHVPRCWGPSGMLDSAFVFFFPDILSLLNLTLCLSLFPTPPFPSPALLRSPRQPGGQIGARLS